MISASIVLRERQYMVEVYVGSGESAKTYRKPFSSEEEARAYLVQAGYEKSTKLAETIWWPKLHEQAFEATLITDLVSETMVPLARGIRASVPHKALVLHVVCVVGGYGFKFSLIGEGPVDVTGPSVIKLTQRDPIFQIVTTDMLCVQALGTWPSVAMAKKAGLDFFDLVEKRVGSELLYGLLGLKKEQGNDRGEEAGVDEYASA